jgi:hypothetical protein
MLSRINAGSTLGGRLGSMGQMLIAGETIADRSERAIKGMEAFNSSLDAIAKRASGEMVKSDWTSGLLIGNDAHGNPALDIHGSAIGNVNYKSFMAAFNAAKAEGSSTVNFQNANGDWIEIYTRDAEFNQGFLLKNNESNYIEQQVAHKDDTTWANRDDVILSNIVDAEERATRTGDRDMDARIFGGTDSNGINHTGFVDSNGHFKVSNRNSVKNTQDYIGMGKTKAQRENQQHMANRRGSGNKGN